MAELCIKIDEMGVIQVELDGERIEMVQRVLLNLSDSPGASPDGPLDGLLRARPTSRQQKVLEEFLWLQTRPAETLPPPLPPPEPLSSTSWSKTTLSGEPPDPTFAGTCAPAPIDEKTGMHKDYWVLPPEERAKGFTRPVRRTYHHVKCGANTTMGQDLAETYARNPRYYGSTFCMKCRGHHPVGAVGEFVWVDQGGLITSEKVGT